MISSACFFPACDRNKMHTGNIPHIGIMMSIQ